jgi:hypothetical protein
MRRTSVGKRLALTARDIEIFKALAQYRFLRSTYLHAFTGGASETRFKERVGDLFHEGYLDRPDVQWRFADARYRPVVHELGEGGREALTGLDIPDHRTWLKDTHKQFEHSLVTCEVLASIDLRIRARTDLRFIPWTEILAKAPSQKECGRPRLHLDTHDIVEGRGSGDVIPDALFGIEYDTSQGKRFRFVAVEIDRGTMPVRRSDYGQTNYLQKIARYKAALNRNLPKSQWGVPNLLVLTIASSKERIENIKRVMMNEIGPHGAFLFRTIEQPLNTPYLTLLDEPFDRVGFDAVMLSRADS